MKYLSTRGGEKNLTFKDILFSGLASDGGLYVPDEWPQIDYNALKKIDSYAELALEIIYPFIGEDIKKIELKELIDNAYAKFSDNKIVTFKNLKQKEHIVELFNGPTLAFKDFAMQLIVPIFDHYLSQEDKKLNLIVATSGDTGSAAINAVHKSSKINVFCLFPKGRISSFQKKQMTTVYGENIFPIEVDGTFDDCQNIVKSILIDRDFSEEFSIAAVNSINWSRVMFQIVYYFYTLIDNKISENEIINFSVPTGNFGDIYAGYVGIKMGLPINKLVIATNENDILDRFINSGNYSIEIVTKTTSPSMDIAIASNFERLLFDLCDKSTLITSEKMNELKKNRSFSVTNEQSDLVKKIFSSKRINQKEVNDLIKETYNEFNYIIDPHTAIGLGASRLLNKKDDNNFILGTAHPIKFSDTVEKSIGHSMELSNDFAKMFSNEEKFYSFKNSAEEVRKIIKDNYSK
jgi:threonine synthase